MKEANNEPKKLLKRAATVVAGAVVVPTVAKKLPFKLNPTQEEIKRMCNTVPQYGRHITATVWDEFAKVPVGTRFYAADGSVYVYMKPNRLVKKGDFYVDYTKNHQHNQA